MDPATRKRLRQKQEEAVAAKRAFVAEAKVLDAVTAVAEPPQEPVLPSPPVAKKPKQRGPGRLPDGAKFSMTYNASEEMWTGSLDADGVVAYSEASALFTLCSKLDGKWRAFKAAKVV